jgi:hypothetical protein
MIAIWQAILDNRAEQEEYFLSLGDNSSSVGWLHKASNDPSKNSPLFLATRKFAQIMIARNSCIYSQHIPCISNKITDALSRRFDLDDATLTSLINSFCVCQEQIFLRIYPVHPEINSWMTYWLQRCNEMRELPKIQETKSVECGKDGVNKLNQLGLPMAFGYHTNSQTNEFTSLEHLLPPSKEENFLSQTRHAWLCQQSKRPWRNWVRYLGQMWGTTPHMDTEVNHYIHYLPGRLKECKI